MRIGTLYPVFLRVGVNEYEVALAQLLEIDDGKAILEIPATRITMGVTESLGDLPERVPEVERRFEGLEQDAGDLSSDAQDDVRRLYEAEGIELDEEPDEQSSGRVIGRQGPSRASSGGTEPTRSLRDMELDDDV